MYKLALVVVVFLLIIFTIYLLPYFIGITKLTTEKVLITIIMIETTYPIMNSLFWLSQRFDGLVIPRSEE